MTLPLTCTTDIDWSATGAWFAGFATWAGFFAALYAMNTWKKQIRVQDCNRKADVLLRSFIMCIRAGHDWYWDWDCGVGKARKPSDDSEKYPIWQNALMDYRLAWYLAHPLFDDNKDRGLSAHPETLQSVIISAFHATDQSYDGFCQEIAKIETAGRVEIINRRDLGLPK